MLEFVKRYFIDPIVYGSGYNPVNTVVYAVLFVVLAFSIYKIIPRRIKFDEKLLISSLPFVFLGSYFRVLKDAGILKSFVFVTPFIWILISSYAVLSFFISFYMFEDNYYKFWPIFAIIPFLIFLRFLRFENLELLIEIILATFASSLVAYAISKPIKVKPMYPMFIHMFDASTTFVALSTGNYFEEHVVGGIVTNALGPIGMYFLKIPVLIFVLKSIEKEPKRLRNYIYLLITILGLGPGTRNMLRLLMGV